MGSQEGQTQLSRRFFIDAREVTLVSRGILVSVKFSVQVLQVCALLLLARKILAWEALQASLLKSRVEARALKASIIARSGALKASVIARSGALESRIEARSGALKASVLKACVLKASVAEARSGALESRIVARTQVLSGGHLGLGLTVLLGKPLLLLRVQASSVLVGFNEVARASYAQFSLSQEHSLDMGSLYNLFVDRLDLLDDCGGDHIPFKHGLDLLDDRPFDGLLYNRSMNDLAAFHCIYSGRRGHCVRQYRGSSHNHWGLYFRGQFTLFHQSGVDLGLVQHLSDLFHVELFTFAVDHRLDFLLLDRMDAFLDHHRLRNPLYMHRFLVDDSLGLHILFTFECNCGLDNRRSTFFMNDWGYWGYGGHMGMVVGLFNGLLGHSSSGRSGGAGGQRHAVGSVQVRPKHIGGGGSSSG
jgi:hypothetical protein